jgi:CRP-like cAMP-binding protein
MTDDDVADETPERHDESGQFTRTYPRSAFRDVLDTADGRLETREVAEQVGCSRETARQVLQELRDDGTVTAEAIGPTLVWSLGGEP